jgi:hypothetical protein
MTQSADLAARIAALFAPLPQVEAVFVSGSRGAGTSDAGSDIDLYVLTRGELDLPTRAAIWQQAGSARRVQLAVDFWGPGDVWVDAASGLVVDAMFFGADWLEDQLRRVIVEQQPSLGYTTAFWRTVRQAQPLFDRQGWLVGLQALAQTPYPAPLRRAIVEHNHPTLRTLHFSYLAQIEKAVERADLVSVNHRLAALLASYFDIIFAFNSVLHPGEKRLLAFAERECAALPEAMSADVRACLALAAAGAGGLIPQLHTTLDRLDALLAPEGFALARWT